MRLAKLMMLNRIGLVFLFVSVYSILKAQDNSPYSRYGLGNISPSTNITSRGMGSVSAGVSDPLSINFSNPASYSGFQAYIEQRSKKVSSGRVVLDVGINFENRSLIVPNTSTRS